jgi:hypothetical protein
MYISMGEPVIEQTDVRDGHARMPWAKCKVEGPAQRKCDITFRVKFRHSKTEFLREAERALARWMTEGRARLLSERRKSTLEKMHENVLKIGYPQDAPVCLLGTMSYRRDVTGWQVVDVAIHSNMTFNSKQLQDGTARCF